MTDLNSHDFRPTEPVEVVLKSKTFANGAMRYPGDRIVLDPKVFQEPDSQRAMRKKNHNIVLASDARAPISIPVPVAPIGPSGPNPDKPQGIPSGAVDAGGRIVGPGGEDGVTHNYVGASPATDTAMRESMNAKADQADNARETLAAFQAEAPAAFSEQPHLEGGPANAIDELDAMSKAEINDLLRSKGLPPDLQATKPQLVLYARTALANQRDGTAPSTTGEGNDENSANTQAAEEAKG